MNQKKDQPRKRVAVRFTVDFTSSEAAKQLRRSEFEESVKKESDLYGKKNNESEL
ncbi:hypothetical protein [Marinobacter sp. ST-43]|uniref:hypothetical protein n=1 Tax=Marinobacter sp. ST-43 TaxID=3050453 RepID=UPI0026E09D89|nr:hypothetical protein [Marinobacter sp. ST-43]